MPDIINPDSSGSLSDSNPQTSGERGAEMLHEASLSMDRIHAQYDENHKEAEAAFRRWLEDSNATSTLLTAEANDIFADMKTEFLQHKERALQAAAEAAYEASSKVIEFDPNQNFYSYEELVRAVNDIHRSRRAKKKDSTVQLDSPAAKDVLNRLQNSNLGKSKEDGK